jgi:hypothetical protein
VIQETFERIMVIKDILQITQVNKRVRRIRGKNLELSEGDYVFLNSYLHYE